LKFTSGGNNNAGNDYEGIPPVASNGPKDGRAVLQKQFLNHG